jgi:hypothetical protein
MTSCYIYTLIESRNFISHLMITHIFYISTLSPNNSYFLYFSPLTKGKGPIIYRRRERVEMKKDKLLFNERTRFNGSIYIYKRYSPPSVMIT